MRSHAIYTAGICAVIATTVAAAPAVKKYVLTYCLTLFLLTLTSAGVDATCGVTTVYVTVPLVPQTIDLPQTRNIVTSDYHVTATTTSVPTLGASAKSIADGLSGQLINSTPQVATAVLETVFTPPTMTSVVISKAETTSISYRTSGSLTDDYVFPNYDAGSVSSLSAPASLGLHPLMLLSDHVTSVHSTEINTVVNANLGGKASAGPKTCSTCANSSGTASNTEVYVVDETLTVIPLSTVSALL